jgi:serine/threonine protein kinase
LKSLQHPVLADINARPGYQITKSLPRHIVEAATFPIPAVDGQVHARLIDFEQAFLITDQSPPKVHTPLIFRAPETLLDSKWDLRMDIWSLGCTIFELVTGQPPFDNFMPAKAPLVLEWIAMFGDVPEEWRNQAEVVVGGCGDDIDGGSLSSWLYETYYNVERKPEFTKEDLRQLGDLLSSMMCYLPEDRLSTHDILKHQWLVKNSLAE